MYVTPVVVVINNTRPSVDVSAGDDGPNPSTVLFTISVRSLIERSQDGNIVSQIGLDPDDVDFVVEQRNLSDSALNNTMWVFSASLINGASVNITVSFSFSSSFFLFLLSFCYFSLLFCLTHILVHIFWGKRDQLHLWRSKHPLPTAYIKNQFWSVIMAIQNHHQQLGYCDGQ